jgi:dienelactone hydrolase
MPVSETKPDPTDLLNAEQNMFRPSLLIFDCKQHFGRRVSHRLNAMFVSMLAMLLGAMLSGCTSLDRSERAEMLASSAHLTREYVDAGPFVLTTYSRVVQPHMPIRIYIEGDGSAWVSVNEPSLDPTPRRPTGLELAASDPAPNVVYIARPCQFTTTSTNRNCGVPYWTGKRFAPEVIDSMNKAVDHFAKRIPGQSVELVGFSGGGAVAVMVAAHRHDVASLRTVAGNLDDEYVNQLHSVSSMPESENAIDFAREIGTVPQIHFSGAADTVVPPSVGQRFVDAVGSSCGRLIVVPDVAHNDGWTHIWPTLLEFRPVCAATTSGNPPFPGTSPGE